MILLAEDLKILLHATSPFTITHNACTCIHALKA